MPQENGPEKLWQQVKNALERGDRQEGVRLLRRLMREYPDSTFVTEARQLLEAKSGLSNSTLGPISGTLLFIMGLAFWALVGLGIAAAFNVANSRSFVGGNWLWLALGFVALVVATVLGSRLEGWIARSDKMRRAGAAFWTLPLFLSLATVVFFTASRQAFVLEMVLIVVVSIIPAAAYYLFLATRRPSIFNEFISNISRLGLLDPRPVRRLNREVLREWHETVAGPVQAESEVERIARVESYLQRFEAVYGRLRFGGGGTEEVNRTEFVAILTRSVSEDRSKDDKPAESMDEHMPQATIHFGDMLRANIIIPLGLCTVLTVAGWVLVMQPSWPTLDAPSAATQTTAATFVLTAAATAVTDTGAETSGGSARDIARVTLVWTPVNFAFLGAYFFGLQMLFRRFVRRDLGPNAYLAFANRILLAVIAVWVTIAAYQALTAFFGASEGQGLSDMIKAVVTEPKEWPAVLLVLAFVVGVFPRMLWQIIQSVIAKLTFLRLAVPSIEAQQPVSDLDGLTVWHESRLEEEDVENVPNMASVDLVDLMLHTQIPAERLVSWVDQAILYVVIGPNSENNQSKGLREALRGLGLRSATQVVAVYQGQPDTDEVNALRAVVDGDSQPGRLDAFVHALQVESNFDIVRAWRRV